MQTKFLFIFKLIFSDTSFFLIISIIPPVGNPDIQKKILVSESEPHVAVQMVQIYSKQS